MKQDKNNEIDLLLRSLARGERSDSPLDMRKVSAREDGVLSDHLDADELNSFAEGVVPAPARARYIAHLADCDSCRGFVIKLTQAAGSAARPETLGQQTGAGFWSKLASLFSPTVLRYAVPALALTAVIAIGFFVMRQQRSREFVAENRQISSVAPPSENRQQPTESPVAQANIESQSTFRSDAESRAGVDSTSGQKSLHDDRSRVAQAPAIATEADAPTASSLKDSSKSKEAVGAVASQPTFAAEPKAAPAPPKLALSEDNRADKATAIQKEEVAKREVQAVPQEEEKNQSRDEAGRHGPSRSNTIRPGSRRADGLMAERVEARAQTKKDSDDEVDSRTVSGKRFRRQGNAWIDTAYDSSRRTINVARGSDQFRALIADEPGIRTIAEKLNGVVIVVWNGRAYRIQ